MNKNQSEELFKIIKSSKKFILKESPEICKQIILEARMSAISWMIGTFIFGVLIFLLPKLFLVRIPDEAIILQIIILFPATIIPFFVNLYEILKTIFVPKYIIMRSIKD